MALEEASLAASAEAVLASAPPRFFLAGTAYGGCLALEVAVTAPERIAGLWLMNCSPGPHPDPEEAAQLHSRVRVGAFREIMEEWAEIIVDPRATAARDRFLKMALAAGPERFLRQHDAAALRRDHWAQLGGIESPTLLLWGEEDRFVPATVGRRMAAAMPAARYIGLPGCRHLPPLEKPALTNQAARSWLTDVLAAEDS
jgi:pimeloyl-ACP methyl ester carboxylesterase